MVHIPNPTSSNPKPTCAATLPAVEPASLPTFIPTLLFLMAEVTLVIPALNEVFTDVVTDVIEDLMLLKALKALVFFKPVEIASFVSFIFLINLKVVCFVLDS